jgi:RHS repeat-associated protein
MPTGYQIINQGNAHFLTLQIVSWVDSSRLGLKKPALGEAVYKGGTFQGVGKQSDGSYFRHMYFYEEDNGGLGPVGIGGTYTPPNYKGSLSTNHAGLKYYELSNHLGNVMSVVNDRKIVHVTGIGLGDFVYQPDVVSATDYYPFGMTMPGRSFSSNAYRYGFNGMEKDDEVKGSGNSYDFGARIYDSRLGRWLSMDPLQAKYPSLSPYNFVANNPIKFVDYDGKDFGVVLLTKSNTIIITANFYTIDKKGKKHANAAAQKWRDLNGKEVTIGEQTYTVEFKINVEMGKGDTPEARLADAKSRSESDPNGNTFLGSKNIEGETVSLPIMDSKLPLEVGVSDGKNITMPRYNVKGTLVYKGNDPKAVAHEMGHNMGLDDPGGKHYKDGGAMDYEGPYNPTLDDVIQIITYAAGNKNTDPNGADPKASFESKNE